MDTQNMHRNLLTAALLLACMPLAQAAEGSEAGPQQTAVSTPQQAQALAEPQMAAQTQASFVLQGVEFAGATGVPESELQAAAAGWDVLLSFHTDQTAADAVVLQITEMGRHAMAVQADIGCEDQIRRLFAVVDVRFGQLNAFVNNAGIVDSATTVT